MKRPEDRSGLRPGSFLSSINLAIYTLIAKLLRELPMFRGKVRIASELKKLFGLNNHHITQLVTLSRPVQYKATLDLHSWLQFLAYFTDGYESSTVQFLSKLYDPKGYFLDLGANIGLIGIPFAKINSDLTENKDPFVYCIEAIDSNFQRLESNVAENKLDRVIVALKCGVGEAEKTVDIQVEGNLKGGEGTGTANIFPNQSNYNAERIQLQITTINSLVDNQKLPHNCSLIKIDLDGYDLYAMMGATKLLKNSRPIIFGEFSRHCMNWHNQSHEMVENFMKKLEYLVFYRDVNSRFFTATNAYDTDGDLLIIPSENLGKFSWCIK